jgi:tetratricopeptide (TPR) repeat protein
MRWWPAVLVVAAGLAAYSDSFGGAFLFDDRWAIVDNAALRRPIDSWQALLFTTRPVVMASLAANYALGGLDVWGYHAVNLSIHLLAALTLYGLVRRTLLLPQYHSCYSGATGGLALAAALLWLVHPLQTESVTYIIQRGESLMGLCYLLTLYAVLRGATARRGSAGWYTLAVLACAVGMGTKEVMVTAPLVALLYDRAFLSPSWAEVVRRRGALYAALAATWPLLAGSLRAALVSDARGASAGFAVEGIPPSAYLLTQAGVLVHYVRLSFWPEPLCLDYYDWPLARTAGAVLLPGLITGALLTAALSAWRHRPALGFLGLSFFLVLAPTSSVMPLADYVVEHRMYLSLAAEVVLAVLAGHALLRRLGQRAPVIGAALTAALVVLLGLLTFARNEDYHSELVMWADVVAKRPNNPRAHNNQGAALKEEGDVDGAIRQYRLALRLDPRYAEAYCNLGAALREQGLVEEAVQAYSRALQLKPRYAMAHNNLGVAYAKRGKWDLAVAEYDLALESDPDLDLAHNNRGEALQYQGRLEAAIASYHRAVALAPSSVTYRCNLAAALYDAGQVEAARAEYAAASRLYPDWPADANASAWGLATAPEPEHRDGARALRYARQACQATGGGDPRFLDTLAAAYAETGRFGEAVATARHALALAAEHPHIAEPIAARLRLYEGHTPYHEARTR